MPDAKPAYEHMEYPGTESAGSLDSEGKIIKPTKGQRVKRHCLRFWWLHLIVFIVLTLLVILLVTYVAYPRIAQTDINASSIINTAQIVLSPSNERLNLSLSGQLTTHSIFKPTLQPFNASLFLPGAVDPFVSFAVPAIHAADGSTFTINQFVDITPGLATYAELLLGLTSFNVFLQGRGKLNLGALPTVNVHYNQSIEVKGLNALKGIDVTNLTLAANQPYNANSAGQVLIPNPSVSTLALGNVSLSLYVADTFLGNSTLPDLTLVPGNETYPLYSTVNETAVLSLLKEDQYRCGVLPVTIKGNQSVFDGEEVAYFTSALQAASLGMTLNLTETLRSAGLGGLITGECT